MMTLWVVLCVLLAAAAGANLMLNFALIGRVRTLSETLGDPSRNAALPALGLEVAPFAVETPDGERITHESVRDGTTLVGFFTAGCKTCERIHRQLLSAPPATPLLAFVYDNGNVQETQAIGTALRRIARVAYFKGDTVSDAFGASQYPTLLRVENGIVAASGRRVEDVVP